jgi:hypothetical protein
MANAVVNWFADKAYSLVNQRAQKAVEALAYDVRERARQNLVEGDHIDTHFLYNSVYVSTPHGTTPIHPAGIYTSTKGNGQVRRDNGEIVRVGRGAFVGVAASYALYVELEDPFLFRAIEETAGASDKVLTGLYRD